MGRWDRMRHDSGDTAWWKQKMQYHSPPVGHQMRQGVRLPEKKMQCHTVTHILLVMGWDTMRLPCQKKLLTLCWSWDHGWDIILHGKMCHSPPVGHGMRHGQPCIRRNAVPVTHMLFGMWHDETARWKKNITHILLVIGRDMMRLLAKEKCSVTHPLLVHGMTPWWNCLLS